MGITPASAGKTQFHSCYRTRIRDHPRECGKNYKSTCPYCKVGGSPPRVREKRTRLTGKDSYTGITPASAGKTNFKEYLRTYSRDHPRECGKNFEIIQSTSLYPGSPPRVREKLNNFIRRLFSCRITPASAGKTPTD